MEARHGRRRRIVVTGDVTMDWNFARPRGTHVEDGIWTAPEEMHAYLQRGGAALLGDLIEAVAKRLDPEEKLYEVSLPESSGATVSPHDLCFHHSFVLWSLFKYAEKEDGQKRGEVWRVKDFLGLQRSAADGAEMAEMWRTQVAEIPRADLIVLDDAALGFREHEDIWGRALARHKESSWIILKMARPIAKGLLWNNLSEHCNERLIVVIPAGDLRLTEVQISHALSWERTAQDVAWELVYNPHVSALSRSAYVIVSFGTAGAVLLAREDAKGEGVASAPQCTLFFDPAMTEGEWARDYPGGMIGYTTCLVASLARQILLDKDAPDIEAGIQAGLSAMQVLHKEGYGKKEAKEKEAPPLAFPVRTIVEELERGDEHHSQGSVKESASTFASAAVQNPARFLSREGADGARPLSSGFWTILEDRCAQEGVDPPETGLHSLAEKIVLNGAKAALKNVPLGQFGKLLTVDRREIENFRSIGALISEYCGRENQDRPLSIAVFGPPGSGKSFGISEVADSVLPGRIKKLTFNLSQFSDPAELLGALHQVRDLGLAGKIPLVFWDEFDTSLREKPLGWLRYFLAPMQDGQFQQGEITHPIGRAIFVFAGGTSASMERFGKDPNAVDEAKIGEAEKYFCEAKGPDFVSRLKGYIDIFGPNPRGGNAATDPHYIIRRAILLRSMLERHAPRLFNPPGKGALQIDSGVLRAFLKIQNYKHGARSMESLISMSLLAGQRRFERSSLPSAAQLDLHVQGRAFLSLVQQIVMDEAVLERLAEAAHKVYAESLKSRKASTRAAQMTYAELPEDEKEQNRSNVRDISRKLDEAGYVMIPARSNEPPFDFPGGELERLAEMEHDRWMNLKLKEGWRYALRTDKKGKLHKAMVPWGDLTDEGRAQFYATAENAAIGKGVLPEDEKEKDRDFVRGIPRILAEAGFTVEKVEEDGEGDVHVA